MLGLYCVLCYVVQELIVCYIKHFRVQFDDLAPYIVQPFDARTFSITQNETPQPIGRSPCLLVPRVPSNFVSGDGFLCVALTVLDSICGPG